MLAARLTAAAPAGDTTTQDKPEHAIPPRARIVTVEVVRGNQGTPMARTALREAIGRHLARRGFQVVEGGRNIAYRLQPTLLLLDSHAGSSVEVKAAVVAVDRKGRTVAMVEGGARGGAPGAPVAAVESQALEAAARSLAEDLARRLLEVR